MPAYQDREARKLYQREYRRRKALEATTSKQAARSVAPACPADPVGALAAWAASDLVVPPGHPEAGRPMVIPDWGLKFLQDGFSAHESALSVARKNGKSALCAVLALGYLVGPLRSPGWRGAIASISKEKAGELRRQVASIVEASGLDVTIRSSPYPGAISSDTGTLETLAAERTAGHSSSFDLVIIDETGLMPERSRELLAGLRSSVSAKGGRIVHCSVRGDSPLFAEVLENPATVAHVYAAEAGCALDDRDAWAAANPGLGVIKQTQYMVDECARLAGAPGDEPSFRAFDLNQQLNPTREMICATGDLKKCFTADLPDRLGPAVLGLDMGEATSATAAAAIWPATGRCELWLGFGDKPPLADRQRRDNAPYLEMLARGELRLFTGRVTPVKEFLAVVARDLAGVRIDHAAADSYKSAEVTDFLDQAGLRWPIAFRRVGAGRDGGADIRAFQRLILDGKLHMHDSLALASAISKSTIRRDANGNPGLDRAHSAGRIDLLSAAVIAAGAAEPLMSLKRRGSRMAFAPAT